MFFENELTGTFTFLHLLLTILIGLAPIAVTLAIKMVLYRRRHAEDEASRSRVDGNGRLKVPHTRTASRHQRYRLVRPLPATFESRRPLA
ncbi:MAG: hypothetical protein ABI443_06800 [Chthoniobacterales bacterium]